jgi:mono/diheme cytochrome c family protein
MKFHLTGCWLFFVFCAGTSVTLRAQNLDSKKTEEDGSVRQNYTQDSTTLEKGKVLFAQLCASCHALAQDGFGPPLGGITILLTEAELLERIRDPGKLMAAGDARATALLRRYKAPMPPFSHVVQEDLSAILAYIHRESIAQKLTALTIDPQTTADSPSRLIPPVVKTNLVIELEDVVQIPRLPGRTAYKGITLLRPDPREDGALLVDELMGLLYRVKDRQVSVFLDVRGIFPEFICDPGVASFLYNALGDFPRHAGDQFV